MSLTFAIIEHKQSYYDFYDVLLEALKPRYASLESGVQSDAWIWIHRDGEKIEIDTFYAMQFEIKAEKDGPFLREVIGFIGSQFPVRLYEPPIER